MLHVSLPNLDLTPHMPLPATRRLRGMPRC
jgi:hypothetical protein